MCQHGEEVMLYVPIPAELSHTGRLRWDYKGIDVCIADVVQALNNAGILTANSCCGHGKTPGSIILHDGRKLLLPVANQQ